MFGELKEAKYFKRNSRFQERYNVNYFKERNRLKSLQKAEAYLEAKQASTMELFVNILNGLLFFYNGSSIIAAIEIFKVKLRWSRSSRLLKRLVFVVWIWMNSEKSSKQKLFSVNLKTSHNIFFISQNLKQIHITYNFLEILMLFWLILVAAYYLEFISN